MSMMGSFPCTHSGARQLGTVLELLLFFPTTPPPPPPYSSAGKQVQFSMRREQYQGCADGSCIHAAVASPWPWSPCFSAAAWAHLEAAWPQHSPPLAGSCIPVAALRRESRGSGTEVVEAQFTVVRELPDVPSTCGKNHHSRDIAPNYPDIMQVLAAQPQFEHEQQGVKPSGSMGWIQWLSGPDLACGPHVANTCSRSSATGRPFWKSCFLICCLLS